MHLYIYLFAEDLQAGLKRLESLLAGLRSGSTENELGIQLPRGGQVPGLGNLGINQRAVVLKVGTEAFGLKGKPDC